MPRVWCIGVFVLYMKTPTLNGQRVTLRPVTLHDGIFFVSYFKDKEVTRYLERQKPLSIKEENAWIRSLRKNTSEYVWTIVIDKNKVIGNTALRLKDQNKIVNFGLLIGDKQEWGKGYAGEVLEVLMRFAFEKLKYNRFELEVRSDNKRGLRAYKKAGLKIEGKRREAKLDRSTGEFKDMLFMSILREEWIKRNKH